MRCAVLVMMMIDIKSVFQLEGSSESFYVELDLSDIERSGGHPMTAPVAASGTVRNQRAVVSLVYSARVEYSAECDRCLDPVTRIYDFNFEHILATSDNGDDEGDIILVPDFRLDIGELAREDILLELPTKFLCRDDCAGLCQRCGANLNHTKCGCDTREIDPRLAILQQLLD